LLGLLHFGHDPIAFMVFAPLVFLFRGEIFSIFPAVCGEHGVGKIAVAR